MRERAILFFIILFLPISFALIDFPATTVIHSTGLNTNISIDLASNASLLSVNNTSIYFENLTWTRADSVVCSVRELSLITSGSTYNVSLLHNNKTVISYNDFVCDDDPDGGDGGGTTPGSNSTNETNTTIPIDDESGTNDDGLIDKICGVNVLKPINPEGFVYAACPPGYNRTAEISFFNPSDQDKTFTFNYEPSTCTGPSSITTEAKFTSTVEITCTCPEHLETFSGYVEIVDETGGSCVQKIPLAGTGNKYGILFLNKNLLFSILGAILVIVIAIAFGIGGRK